MSNIVTHGESLSEEIIIPGEQADGSIVDMYGNIISIDERLSIVEAVSGLPVVGYKDNIKDAVNDNSIVIIEGETGSGKTTQIPKMFFNPNKSIVVTQPRVLAAMSNASRVSQELLAIEGNPYYSLGHGIGYRTGKGVSSKGLSPLSFHTDGLELMRQVVSGKTPDVLVLDEVHNFSIPTEILAMLMKYNQSIKMIIMSATLNPEIFQEYYKDISSNIPVIKIPGRTFPVKRYLNPAENYIDSIATHYTSTETSPGKNILFFVPGKKEIEENVALLKQKLGKNAQVFPLHAEMSREEQHFLLKNTTGKPRIIVATNVAEESITIDYIDIVFDLGTHKVLRHNFLGIDELKLENTSQANSNQRAGRAGRTHPGEYIRTNDTDFNDLPEYPDAPIEKELLDRYILILLEKGIDLEESRKRESEKGGKLFFHDFNDRLYNIALFRLRKIGAISSKGKITNLGKNLLQFPVDVYNARIIVEGIQRKCSEEMIYVAAILEKKGFLSKEGGWKKLKLKSKGNSDIFAYVDLFRLLTSKELSSSKIKQLCDIGLDQTELNNFIAAQGEKKLYECVNLEGIGIKMKRLLETDILVSELISRFDSFNIPLEDVGSIDDKKICLVSGSLHNIFKYDVKQKKFKNRDHKDGKNALYFTKGNISLLEKVTSTGYYLGIPFIVGGTDGQEDFNVITFLTKVDEGHVSEVDHIRPNVPGILSKSTDRLTVNEAIQNAARGIELFEHKLLHKGFSTPELAEDFYLKKCLPDFLVGFNHSISRYLEGKTPEQVFIFRNLITRFLQAEKHRISKVNPQITQTRFTDDTGILENFLNSKDPDIVAFREGKILSVSGEESTLISDVGVLQESIFDKDVFEWQKKYATLVGVAKGNNYFLDEKGIKLKVTEKFLDYLQQKSPEYNSLSLTYNNLGKLEIKEVQEMCKQLKQVTRGKRKLKTLHHTGGELREFKKLIELIIKNGSLDGVDEEYISDFLLGSNFLLLRTDKILNAINSFHSTKDKRKHKRSVELLNKKFLPYIESLIFNNDAEVQELSSRINLEDIPLAHTIKDDLSVLLPSFFIDEYFHTMVSHQVLDLIREIARDQITEKKGLEKIISDFLMKFNYSHSSQLAPMFNFFEEYNGILYELEAYSHAVYASVKSSKDSVYIKTRYDELAKKIQEYKEKLKRVKDIVASIQ